MIAADTAMANYYVYNDTSFLDKADALYAFWRDPSEVFQLLGCVAAVPCASAVVPTAAAANAAAMGTMAVATLAGIATTAAAKKSGDMVKADTLMAGWRKTENVLLWEEAEALYADWRTPSAVLKQLKNVAPVPIVTAVMPIAALAAAAGAAGAAVGTVKQLGGIATPPSRYKSGAWPFASESLCEDDTDYISSYPTQKEKRQSASSTVDPATQERIMFDNLAAFPALPHETEEE